MCGFACDWEMDHLRDGRADNAFEPRRLAVALPGLLRSVTATPPVELGFEVEGFLTVVRIDEDGPERWRGPTTARRRLRENHDARA